MLIKTRNKFRKGARFAIVAAIIFAGVFINIMFVAAAPPKATASATLPATTCTSTGPTSRTCDLWATTGNVTMPDGQLVNIWGYVDSAAGLGAAQLPGPALIVNEGEEVTVNLTNDLSENTSIYFQGIDMMPDLTGVAPGGTTSYTFTATNPGTYLYEAGLLSNAQHQVAMGMYGALIVRPATAGQAYNRVDTTYDDEALIILSEIDPDFNNSADPATFDLRNYAPKYSLINGDGYDLATPNIDTAAGNNVLLRYVNAGLENHTMSLLGVDQTLLAIDGNLHPYTRTVVAEIIGAGTTVDVMVDIPASAADGSKFALYDADLLLHNNNDQGYGGMLTFLEIPPGVPGGDTLGPVANPVDVSPSPTDGTSGLTIVATVSDFDTGGSVISTAEYFIDTPGIDGTGAAMGAVDLTFDSVTEDVIATISALDLDAMGLASGEHTIYIHGQDSLGNWGSFNLSIFNLVNEGPVTKGITLTHDPSAGDRDVLLSATGDDTATGNSNIVDAEYFIDTAGPDGTGVPMTVNVAAPIASLDSVISAATLLTLSEGVHTIHIHNQDAYGHWGPLEVFDLQIDHTGPDATATVAPTPNNGLEPINPSQFSIRIDATLDDPIVGVTGSSFGFQSNLYEAEYYIDLTGLSIPIPNPAPGDGAPMYPRDGIFDSTNEDAYAFISLITINSFPDGLYDICVRGRDAAGNWGSCVITVLEINRGVPTVSNVTATPNPTGGATIVALSALASGAGFDIDTAEWFTGADPGIGNGTPMSIAPNGPDWDVTDNIDVTGWATGSHTLYVRARNTAGTWSATGSVVLTIDTAAPIYGVTLTPTDDAKPGTPGATVTYLLDVTNTGNIVDTYDITFAGNAWVTSATPTPIMLAAGGTAQITVDVTIGVGTSDTVVVTATSQGSPLLASSTLTTTAVQDLLYFSTVGNFAVPGVVGPYDDADVYSWDGSSFSRIFDARVAGNPGGINLPGNADIDGLVVADSDTIYMSFSRNAGVNVPGVGIVDDEDIVLYDAGVWSLYFDGNEVGLGDSNGEDVDAFEILPDGSILLSAVGNFNPDPDFAIDRRDEDVIRCVPSGGLPITACTWSDYFDGSDVGLSNGGGEDVVGISQKDGDFYLTTLGGFAVSGLSGDSFDVFSCDAFASGAATGCTSFTMYFDGSVEGVTNRIDAIDLP